MYSLISYLFSFLMLRFFFFNDTATTEIYTLSLLDALPIFVERDVVDGLEVLDPARRHERLEADDAELGELRQAGQGDRKSTRLNSSHQPISYDAFCLKKKNLLRDNNR